MVLLASCGSSDLDWDLRGGGGALSTSDAARQATADRPLPDSRGVLSYPGYQVALAQRGDTVATVAQRVGLSGGDLAAFNALRPEDPLRAGEVLALPTRVASAAPLAGTGTVIGAPISTGAIDVTSLATGAIDRAAPGATAPLPAAAVAGPEPARHKVARGETAFSIARTYAVSAKALAEWNGLDADMNVREGQTLLIPVALPNQPAIQANPVTPPGAGTPAPLPPSASKPLPDEDVEAASTARPAGTPASPDLGESRTAATAAKFAMPVDGKIIRPYGPPKSLGIDISAPPGASVRAAADGTVAAITKDTDGTSIVILRHADNILTVYGGVDAVSVAKGATVSRGTGFAKIRATANPFLHFEVRKGFDAVDPGPYLQ
jgi:murein DD-endopeptidase MepM/ murein hydrolase activator NlpD